MKSENKNQAESYSIEIKKDRTFVIAFVGFFISFVNLNLTCCICGYLDFVSLPGSIIGFALAWYALLMHKKFSITKRVITCFLCIVTALILFKNIADILWFGHNALLI
jgi:hypothetical protein